MVGRSLVALHGRSQSMLSGAAQPQSVNAVLQPRRPHTTCVALHRIKALSLTYLRSEAALHKSTEPYISAERGGAA